MDKLEINKVKIWGMLKNIFEIDFTRNDAW